VDDVMVGGGGDGWDFLLVGLDIYVAKQATELTSVFPVSATHINA
jgi:hypothetical protein